jgi:hypothetical protein
MDEALKHIVIPRLREMGFTGSRPNFRRKRGDTWDLLAFQFSAFRPAFIVELGRWPDAEIHRAGRILGPKKATLVYTNDRHRLGAEGRGDHWFVFEGRAPEIVAGEVIAMLDDPKEWRQVDGLEVTKSDF